MPYPHAQPLTGSKADLAWSDHVLLFMFEPPSEFGARLWNGICFKPSAGESSLAGTPQEADLGLIVAPPAKRVLPPSRPALRDDIHEGARWFRRLAIE